MGDLEAPKALIYFIDYVLCTLRVPPLSPFQHHFMWLKELAALFFEWRNTIRKAHQIYGQSVDSFISLAQTLRLYENSFTSKHCASLFGLSKRVNPTSRARPTRLTQGEFQEALGRLILVRVCKSDEKKKRRESTMGLGPKKAEKASKIGKDAQGNKLRGKKLFIAGARAILQQNSAQINENRKQAFMARMETLLKMVDEKVRVKA